MIGLVGRKVGVARIFLLVSCLIMGYVGAWIAATRHIAMLDNKL